MTESDEGDERDPDTGSGGAEPDGIEASDPADTSEGIEANGPDGTPVGAGSAGDGTATVDPEAIGVPRRLDARVRYRWILGSSLGALAVGVGLTVVAALYLDEYLWVGAVVAAALVLLGVVRAVLLYRSWRYYVREESLFLRRGVLTRVQTVVPYVRVQHIDTRRSPVERALGLSSLVVYTAGSRGADVTIPGLTPDRADTLQSRLERLAIESEEDAV